MPGAARRLPLRALLPPLQLLLLLLAATTSSYARPHKPSADAGSHSFHGQASDPESQPSYFAPGAWRPVVDPPAGAAAPRSSGSAPFITHAASRVRVEDTNRSARLDAKQPSTQAATSVPAATTSASTATSPKYTTVSAATATTAAAAATAATATTVAPPADATKATAATTATAPHLGAAIHRVTSQLLTAAEDVRTPPKLRHQQENRGQGVAVPVILEEDELEHPEEVLIRRTSTSKPPEEGISTWVLLSGSHDSSPAPSTTSTTTAPRTTVRTPKPATPRPATKRTTTARPTTALPKRPATTKKPAYTTTTTSKPTTAVPTTTLRSKPIQNTSTKKNSSMVDAPLAPTMTRKPPTALQKSTTPVPVSTADPKLTTTTTVLPDVSEDETTTLMGVTESPENGTTSDEAESKTETSTRRTRRPSSGGKKKKNKNKRRKTRPSTSNSTAVAESKIGEVESNSTKPAQNKERPLSTRIYNYLAREVMPSFGVGLLGLAITAGLAGLIMYPFGGTAAKRTYEVDGPSLPNQGNFYYYGGEYDGDDHGQAEESVIRKVFEGMNTENEQPDESGYSNSRYPTDDTAIASGTVTTYAGDIQQQQHNKYPSHRYDTSQSGYAATGNQGAYNSGGQTGYNSGSRPDPSTFYNVEQANKYYSPSSSASSSGAGSGAPSSASSSNTNATDSGNGARVRYREVATGTVMESSAPNPQQITKKSDYYGYNTGRVRYRDVGTGEVTSDYQNQAPRVRFREVGSDTVHYSLSDQTSSDGGIEHGPRNVRVKRQAMENVMEDVGRKVEDVHVKMADAQRKMAAEVAELAEHAKKLSDKSNELGNEIEMLYAKKNRPKKVPVKPIKIKKGTADDDCDHSQQKKTEWEMEEITTEDDVQGFTEEGTTPDISDVELVTGTPDATSMELLSEHIEEIHDTNNVHASVYSASSTESPDTTEVTNMQDTVEPTDAPAFTTENQHPEESSTKTPLSTTTSKETLTTTPNPTPGSFIDLLKQVAKLKVRLGISFLKSTSLAFTRYLDRVQKNMEDAIRKAREVEDRRSNFWNFRRLKREAEKTLKMKKNKSD